MTDQRIIPDIEFTEDDHAARYNGPLRPWELKERLGPAQPRFVQVHDYPPCGHEIHYQIEAEKWNKYGLMRNVCVCWDCKKKWFGWLQQEPPVWSKSFGRKYPSRVVRSCMPYHLELTERSYVCD